MRVSPYLSFDGTCREAMKFYAGLLDGEVTMMLTHRGSPMEAHSPPEMLDKIMHARVVAGDVELMASDCPPGMFKPMQGLSVSLMLEDVAEAERVFAGLAEGGQVLMPIGETFWAERFGMVIDRFGTPWMINVEKDYPASG